MIAYRHKLYRRLISSINEQIYKNEMKLITIEKKDILLLIVIQYTRVVTYMHIMHIETRLRC